MGCCGPDATVWLQNEMSNHYEYSRNAFREAPIPNSFDIIGSLGSIGPISDLASRISGIDLQSQTISTQALKLATYGLAVDYGYIDYHVMANIVNHENRPFSCPSGVISVCGQCQNSTDYGNFILGIVIHGAGEDRSMATFSGELFNLLSGDTSSLADTSGVEKGYDFAASGQLDATDSYALFCSKLRNMGSDWHDVLPSGCQSGWPCQELECNITSAPNSEPRYFSYVSQEFPNIGKMYLDPIRELYGRIITYLN